MPEALSDAQWAGIRAIAEGATPTHARAAACAGIHVTTVSHRAAREGWKTLDFRRPRIRAVHRNLMELADAARAGEEIDPVEEPGEVLAAAEMEEPEEAELDDSPEVRLARIADMLTRRLEALLKRAEGGRPIEGRQVAALSALLKLYDGVAALPRPPEAETSHDELVDTLQKIDDRIVELARIYAKSILVANGMSEAEAQEAIAKRA